MNKSLYVMLVLLAGCVTAEGEKEQNEASVEAVEVANFPEKAKDMTIYEVNIRQHTPEGTFNAFAEHLPRLKELGVDILWLMPVQEIGVKNRKGTLGSYYSIKDYREVNPEFGTLEDFKNLVRSAHDQGFYVILDWVPNHTAWDHPWIESHPDYYMNYSFARVIAEQLGVGEDYYKRSGTGDLVYEADWSDIALLNLYNENARKAMIDEMKFWITETDIDGFRCDHAGHEIPLFFWEEAAETLNPLKDLFWLAEWDEPRMHLMFHATYDWKLLHLTEDVAVGKKTAEDLHEHIRRDLALYGHDPFRLNMITNHDENAWAGTIQERYGEGARAFAVFAFTAYGIPMIYSGQEAGMDKKLEFFEKDTISWEDPEDYFSFYSKLNQIKEENPALYNGGFGAITEKLEDDNEYVFSFRRTKEQNDVVGIINLSGQSQKVVIDQLKGEYTDTFTGNTFNPATMTLEPWQYVLFTTNEAL